MKEVFKDYKVSNHSYPWVVEIDSDEVTITYKDEQITISREDLEEYWENFNK